MIHCALSTRLYTLSLLGLITLLMCDNVMVDTSKGAFPPQQNPLQYQTSITADRLLFDLTAASLRLLAIVLYFSNMHSLDISMTPTHVLMCRIRLILQPVSDSNADAAWWARRDKDSLSARTAFRVPASRVRLLLFAISRIRGLRLPWASVGSKTWYSFPLRCQNSASPFFWLSVSLRLSRG